MASTQTQTPWWKDAVVYQVYPASFKDSDGDGWGDIPGIISELDHIKEVGTTVVWLSPHYASPQEDMGYDISDYEAVYSRYGTMEDMDKLISEIHKRGMKLICDLVINHTSKEHAWFKESRSSRDNDKADWYIWRDAKIDADGNRQPPTNWRSYFSGSAWQWDETRQQYYLRLFAEGQPDLNWENEDTREAIYKSAVKFWLDKGVDGFRIDTAGLYSKSYPLKDAEEDLKTPIDGFAYPKDGQTSNGPRIHEFHKEMFSKVISHYDAMTVGEVGGSSKEDTLKYVSAKEKEMNMIFLFNLVDIGSAKGDKFNYVGFTPKQFKDAIFEQSNFIKDLVTIPLLD
ncbi:unnamed protein product [Ambrosiozyma monospora]|uniref:Unnamed protein product n=1 Tax=Ambrosiozyma monospora TaxID=43982 RepID=A0A9W7DD00_AMBMO|nr:unnamed protein product [Ambrosiozyma monospora]